MYTKKTQTVTPETVRSAWLLTFIFLASLGSSLDSLVAGHS